MSPEIKKALNDFQINGCNRLNGTGIDAVHEILPMIEGIATVLEVGFRKDFDGKALFDEYNPELVASVFGSISYLAGLAKFHADQSHQ